jgi:AP-2 complex subunit mu-1
MNCLMVCVWVDVEMCDFGIPQTTEIETLQSFIASEEVLKVGIPFDPVKIAIQATGAISWRRQDIKYRKNECFVDVIESIHVLISSKGVVLRQDVSGQVVMRSYLSGMPECKLGLNDKVQMDKVKKQGTKNVEMDDCQFHQCVKLGRFDSDRTIHFIPPDGEFELMRYRMTENIAVPFKVRAVVNEVSPSRVEITVTVKSLFSDKMYAQNVVLKIPVPLNTASTTVYVEGGRAKYVGEENCFVWKYR